MFDYEVCFNGWQALFIWYSVITFWSFVLFIVISWLVEGDTDISTERVLVLIWFMPLLLLALLSVIIGALFVTGVEKLSRLVSR